MELAETSCDFNKVPLSALGFKAKDLLTRELDKYKVLPSPEGLPRDHRGLAQIAGVSCNDTRNPTLGVFALWLQCQPQPSIQDLIDALGRLARWDVLDDMQSLMQMDAFNFTLKERQHNIHSLQSPTFDDNIVTYDDADLVRIGLPPDQRYDAYLLYADKDEETAKKIVDTLEGPAYRRKLCLKDRDILPGAGFEHEAITYLISERCNRLIVVMTPNFLDSPAHKFIYNYAIALQLSEKKKKIVPCIFMLSDDNLVNLKLRRITFSAFPINFTRENHYRNNWQLLCDAISTSPSASCQQLNGSASKAIQYCSSKDKAQVELTNGNLNTIKITEITSTISTCSISDSTEKNQLDDSITNVQSDSSKQLSSECSSTHSTAHLITQSQKKNKRLTLTNMIEGIKKTKVVKTLTKKKTKAKTAEALPS